MYVAVVAEACINIIPSFTYQRSNEYLGSIRKNKYVLYNNMNILIVFLLIVVLLYGFGKTSRYSLPSQRYLSMDDEISLSRPDRSRVSGVFAYCSPESWEDCKYEKRMALNVGGIPNIPH